MGARNNYGKFEILPKKSLALSTENSLEAETTRAIIGYAQGYFLRNELLTGESKMDKNFRTYRLRDGKNFGNTFKFL